jgi:uncharacterized membrane protein
MNRSTAYQTRVGEPLALGMGWFSLALGAAELAAPRTIARLIGVPADDRTITILRAYGVRELGAGAAILAQPERATWLWTRVAGDLLDLGTLAAAMRSPETDRGRAALAVAAVLGATALDVVSAQRLSREEGSSDRRPARTARPQNRISAEEVVTINAPLDMVRNYWRNFENLPRFMRRLESVELLDHGRSRWHARGPGGIRLEWTSELVNDLQDRISWRTSEGSDLQHSGSVRFEPGPGGRGTEVRVRMEYTPPAGRVGMALAKMLGADPKAQLREDLHRFKQLMETGEIALSEGPALWRPAQPAADPKDIRHYAGV